MNARRAGNGNGVIAKLVDEFGEDALDRIESELTKKMSIED